MFAIFPQSEPRHVDELHCVHYALLVIDSREHQGLGLDVKHKRVQYVVIEKFHKNTGNRWLRYLRVPRNLRRIRKDAVHGQR